MHGYWCHTLTPAGSTGRLILSGNMSTPVMCIFPAQQKPRSFRCDLIVAGYLKLSVSRAGHAWQYMMWGLASPAGEKAANKIEDSSGKNHFRPGSKRARHSFHGPNKSIMNYLVILLPIIARGRATPCPYQTGSRLRYYSAYFMCYSRSTGIAE